MSAPKCGCVETMIRCVHYAGWVATLALSEAGGYEISGGHDADVEPDYVLRYDDWATAESSWLTVAEDLRTLLHDEPQPELAAAIVSAIEVASDIVQR